MSPWSPRTESGAGGHLVALPGGGRRVLRRRAALVPQPGAQQRPARHGHGDLQAPLPGEGRDEEKKKIQDKTLSWFFFLQIYCLDVFGIWSFIANKMGLASLGFASFIDCVDAPAEARDHQHDGPQPLSAPLQLGSTGHQCTGQQRLQL